MFLKPKELSLIHNFLRNALLSSSVQSGLLKSKSSIVVLPNSTPFYMEGTWLLHSRDWPKGALSRGYQMFQLHRLALLATEGFIYLWHSVFFMLLWTLINKTMVTFYCFRMASCLVKIREQTGLHNLQLLENHWKDRAGIPEAETARALPQIENGL